MAKNKKKKQKVKYYDDNSTISDMSNLTSLGRKNPAPPPNPRSTFKEKWNTYWAAVKMMVFPMLIALLVLGFLYMLIMAMTGQF